MNLDERLTRASHRVADGLNPPHVDLDAVRARARSNRRRTTSLVIATTVVATLVAVTVAGGWNTRTSSPPVSPAGQYRSCASNPDPREMARIAPRTAAIAAAQREWIDNLPVGAPPLTPWWHDGVLHVGDVEIETPFQVKEEMIEVAGDTVLVGDPSWDDKTGKAEWAVVRGDRLEPLPSGDSDPHLSIDGRMAFWYTKPSETGSVVIWDVETNREITTRNLGGPELLGIDADGIGYLGPGRLTEWDIRADIMKPSDLTWDNAKTTSEQCSLLPDLRQRRLERGYVSPDGTRKVFTETAPGDTSTEGDTIQLRVRPAGPIKSVDPGDITTLALPEGIPHLTLWHGYSDRGTWGVWWETNETVLLDALVDGRSYLVRCATTGAECEKVFELGPGLYPPPDQGAFYDPTWGSDWSFAHAPLTQ